MPKEPEPKTDLAPEFKSLLRWETRIQDAMRKVEEKAARMAAVGAFAEHKGKALFTELDSIQSMNIAHAPNAVMGVFSRDWGLDQSIAYLGAQASDPSSIYHRAIGAAFDHTDSEHTQEVFTYLTSQIPSQNLGELRDASEDDMQAWWAKIHLLGDAYQMVQHKKTFEEIAYGEDGITSEMEAFSDRFRETVTSATTAADEIPDDDLMWFLTFYDIGLLVESADVNSRAKWKFRKRMSKKIPEGLGELFDDARDEGRDKWQMELEYGLQWAMEKRWGNMRDNVVWEDLVAIIDLMPYLRTDDMALKLIDTIEDVIEIENEGELNPRDISPEGVASFIHHDVLKNANPMSIFSSVDLFDEDLEESVEFGGISVPKRLLPSTAIQLLSDFSSRINPDEFTNLLQSVQDIVVSGKKGDGYATLDEWLLTLALLKNRLEEEKQTIIDEVIGADSFPHKPFSGVLLNVRPGKIWLLKDGKIRVTEHEVANATSIHVSTYVAPEITQKEPEMHVGLTGPKEKVIYVGKQRPQVEIEKKSKKRKANGGRSTKSSSEPQQSDTDKKQRNERPRPVLIMPSAEELSEMGKNISALDLQVVVRSIVENQADGRHPISLMRAKGPEGIRYAKMRVNGVDNGIRVVFENIGENSFRIQSIKYRSKAYRDL